jgi:acetyl-CoA acetyltransferase
VGRRPRRWPTDWRGLAGKPRTTRRPPGAAGRFGDAPEWAFEGLWGTTGAVAQSALVARRHMHEFGTTPEELAWIKVAFSRHARHNPDALLPEEVTVEEVVGSRMICDPLHLLDCCVITDGGGAVVVVHPDVARSLGRGTAVVLGHGEAPRHSDTTASPSPSSRRSRTSASARRGGGAGSSPTAGWRRPTATCPATPTAGVCAATTPATVEA